MFQAVKGMGTDEGVAVGDVLLPASGLPFSVFLGVRLKPEPVREGRGLRAYALRTVRRVEPRSLHSTENTDGTHKVTLYARKRTEDCASHIGY